MPNTMFIVVQVFFETQIIKKVVSKQTVKMLAKQKLSRKRVQ